MYILFLFPKIFIVNYLKAPKQNKYWIIIIIKAENHLKSLSWNPMFV